jgi:hypothetical protein
MALDVMLGWRDLHKLLARFGIWRFLSNISAKNLLINSHQAHQIAAHPFIISQWVYQMIIQAHLGIIMALDVMLGWRDLQAVGKIWDLALLVHQIVI